jgi:hypothetical protein
MLISLDGETGGVETGTLKLETWKSGDVETGDAEIWGR